MFWNRVAVLKLLAVGRVLVARAYRGRTFVKIDHALCDRFRVALDKVTIQQPISVRERRLGVFFGAVRRDRVANDQLGCLAGTIYLTTGDLEGAKTTDLLRLGPLKTVTELSRHAAKFVIQYLPRRPAASRWCMTSHLNHRRQVRR